MHEDDSQLLKPHTIRHGTRIDDWMKGLEVLIVLESALQNVFRLAQTLHVRKCVLILNLDWTDPTQVQVMELAHKLTWSELYDCSFSNWWPLFHS
jgi:hypothetical protein